MTEYTISNPELSKKIVELVIEGSDLSDEEFTALAKTKLAVEFMKRDRLSDESKEKIDALITETYGYQYT